MTEQPEHQRTGTHGPDGDFIETTETAERDAEACRLRSRGQSYRQIARTLGVSESTAHRSVQRGLAAIRREPAQEVRELELDRLDDMWQAVMRVLEARHVTISNGRVVTLEGEPVADDAPVLQAVDRLLKIQERRARLLGLDAEKKINLSGGVKYEVVGIDPGELT